MYRCSLIKVLLSLVFLLTLFQIYARSKMKRNNSYLHISREQMTATQVENNNVHVETKNVLVESNNVHVESNNVQPVPQRTVVEYNTSKRMESKQEKDIHEDIKCAPEDFKKRLPDAILIGEQKCGTAAILSFLSMVNLQIRWNDNEAHFFDKERILNDTEFEKYRNKMAPSCPSDITIEKTPSYVRNKHTPHMIREWRKDIKLLVSLCDPIDRAVSHYAFMLRRITEGAGYLQKWRHYLDSTFDELAICANGVNQTFLPVMYSRYDSHLKPWLEQFPIQQIHIIDADNFVKNNPSEELMKIERYLGLEPKCTEDRFYLNEERGFYCVRNEECMGREKGHHHQAIADRTREILHEFYIPHVQRLKDMTGQQLTWMDKYLHV